MTFKTSPNRILVTEDNGHTTLDTNQPMPHILQTATVNKSVSMPNCSGTASHIHNTLNYTDNYQECGTEYVCKNVYECGMDYSQNPPVYTCQWVNRCAWEYVCHNRSGTRIETICANQLISLHAREWESVQNLVALEHVSDADFVQVRVEATRTSAGTDPKYGTFVAVVPSGQILAQGSTILESSFLPGGASWLRRIMSVYVEGGYVKVKFKSSNRTNQQTKSGNGLVAVDYSPFNHPGQRLTYPDPNQSHDSIASAFSFTFHITIGKFTQ